MTAAEFDSAVATLRRVVVGGEALPPLAHASGRPTGRLAADLHAFLRDLDRHVHVAERTEGRVMRIGARGDPEEVVDLPPGWTLKARPEQETAPTRAEAAPAEPLTLVVTARGEMDEVMGLPAGYRLVPRDLPS